ncbi:MAG: hypothetical protein M0Q94_15075 [Candidatus Cloacimonetes bacterium]|nr:hypothetical protein [Candidatus Cloacimonadota bacterium]
MNNQSRSLGYLVRTAVQNNPNILPDVCSVLNLSSDSKETLFEACDIGLIVTPDEYVLLAQALAIDPDKLLTYENSDQYSKLIHCRGSFSNQSDCDKILDLIDSYIELVEESSAHKAC